MTDGQRELVEKARESVAAARLLLDGGHPDFAVSRAYYAMFYMAEALLDAEGLAFSKHSGVIAAFGREFARPKRVPVELHRHLIDAQALRQLADYGAPASIGEAEARHQISNAEQFINVAEGLLSVGGD